MAFTADERVQIRKWIGIAEIFHDRDPRVESAMSAIEQISPEGEAMVRTYLAKLVAVENAIEQEILNCAGTIQVNQIRQDNIRGSLAIEKLGRRYVGFICRALGMEGPISDPFSSPAVKSPGIHPLSHVPPNGGWPS